MARRVCPLLIAYRYTVPFEIGRDWNIFDSATFPASSLIVPTPGRLPSLVKSSAFLVRKIDILSTAFRHAIFAGRIAIRAKPPRLLPAEGPLGSTERPLYVGVSYPQIGRPASVTEEA